MTADQPTMPIRARASAPSQAFLLGEHAVLYRQPALAASIDVRSHVTVEVTPKSGVVEIESTAFESGLRARLSGESSLVDVRGHPALEPLARGIARFLGRQVGRDVGLRVKIDSDVPVNSGMASSASVSAALVAAASGALGLGLSREEILEETYSFETIIHGKASKTGPACAVLGGIIWIEWSDGGMSAEPLGEAPSLSFVMGITGKPSRTKEMIEKVAKLAEEVPAPHAKIVSAIGDLVRSGREALMSGDAAALGRLMNVNHGLLAALGVSSPELDRIVWAARSAGALGSKLSGAGGGGCAVSLSEEGAAERIASAIEECGFRSLLAPLAEEGVRIEEVVS